MHLEHIAWLKEDHQKSLISISEQYSGIGIENFHLNYVFNGRNIVSFIIFEYILARTVDSILGINGNLDYFVLGIYAGGFGETPRDAKE